MELTSNFYKKISLILELVIFSAKLLAFTLVSGAALYSEMLHSLADVLDSVFVYIGLKLSRRKPDPAHPFGYGKETFFWALVTAFFMLAVTATLSIYKGVNQLQNPQPLHNLSIGVWSLAFGTAGSVLTFAIGIIVIRGSGRFSIERFKSYLDQSVKVKVAEDFASIAGNILSLAAILIYKLTGDIIYDAAAGIIVGLLLAFLGFAMAAESKDMLIGRAATRAQRKLIRSAVYAVPEVKRIMELKTMLLGPDEILVNIEVNLVDDLRTDEVERAMDEIRKKIRKSMPETTHIQIEAESV